ncbi:hypothetical protein ACFR9U_17275 [Halorientalis brevis]|uniref:Uncharacterized protein n=1 Tax=Halorientalis brevis TaxID=1126241 RepID=A0ABD6CEW4_9EURY|nr:hypothetical protein [Halorientalis brevis]
MTRQIARYRVLIDHDDLAGVREYGPFSENVAVTTAAKAAVQSEVSATVVGARLGDLAWQPASSTTTPETGPSPQSTKP